MPIRARRRGIGNSIPRQINEYTINAPGKCSIVHVAPKENAMAVASVIFMCSCEIDIVN
jgi:hypothetical protein